MVSGKCTRKLLWRPTKTFGHLFDERGLVKEYTLSEREGSAKTEADEALSKHCIENIGGSSEVHQLCSRARFDAYLGLVGAHLGLRRDVENVPKYRKVTFGLAIRQRMLSSWSVVTWTVEERVTHSADPSLSVNTHLHRENTARSHVSAAELM